MPKGVPKQNTQILNALDSLVNTVSDISSRLSDIELVQADLMAKDRASDIAPKDIPTPVTEFDGTPGVPAKIPSFQQTVPAPTNNIGKINWTGGIQNQAQSSGYEIKGEVKIMDDLLIPEDYKRAKNEILGENFKLKIAMFSDRPEMYVTITVPPEYSNMMPSEPMREDERGQVIANNQGINGITKFFQNIALNLQSKQVGNRPVSLK